jgi:branched-subunit amino acid ABC-type transport system permease component
MRLRRRLRRRTAVQSRLFCRPARSASRSACSARALGVAIERLVVRPLWDRSATMFVMILATLAAQIVIERATLIAVGDQPKSIPVFTAADRRREQLTVREQRRRHSEAE